MEAHRETKLAYSIATRPTQTLKGEWSQLLVRINQEDERMLQIVEEDYNSVLKVIYRIRNRLCYTEKQNAFREVLEKLNQEVLLDRMEREIEKIENRLCADNLREFLTLHKFCFTGFQVPLTPDRSREEIDRRIEEIFTKKRRYLDTVTFDYILESLSLT